GMAGGWSGHRGALPTNTPRDSQGESFRRISAGDIHGVNGVSPAMPRKSSVHAVYQGMTVISHGNELTDFF
ncbi:hypothetical protein ABTE37_19945, partial [Acinetobacter baumannii]